MNAEDLEELEAAQTLDLHDQYRAALPAYRFEVLIPDARYLANKVDVKVLEAGHSAYFEVTLTDVWAWASHRPVRTLGRVLVHSFDTVIIEDRKPI